MKPLNYLLILLLFFMGCSKNETDHSDENMKNPFIGTWVNTEFHDSVYAMTRSNDFAEDEDGFQFNSDGTFRQRAIAGGCATPPVSYVNYPGNWTTFPNNNLFIETEFWGGLTSFEIEIISVNENKMTYKIWQLQNQFLK